MKTITLQIDGMTCDGCISKLDAALGAVSSAAQVTVSLKPPQATVQIDADRVTINDLVQAVRSAGFNVTGFTST